VLTALSALSAALALAVGLPTPGASLVRRRLGAAGERRGVGDHPGQTDLTGLGWEATTAPRPPPPERRRVRDHAVPRLRSGVPPVWRAAASVAGLLVDRARRQRAEQVRAAEVTDACLALVGELRAGQPPPTALGSAAGAFPSLLGPAAARARLGGDVADALRSAASAPGAGALGAVAAAWEVCERSGAGLADTLARVADSLRAEEAVRREAAGQLASVRATTRLLAVLPLITLLALSGGGGRPLAFLLGHAVGLTCLVVGASLTSAGLLWVERLVRSATRPVWSTR
jgi:tight adherence protein B